MIAFVTAAPHRQPDDGAAVIEDGRDGRAKADERRPEALSGRQVQVARRLVGQEQVRPGAVRDIGGNVDGSRLRPSPSRAGKGAGG